MAEKDIWAQLNEYEHAYGSESKDDGKMELAINKTGPQKPKKKKKLGAKDKTAGRGLLQKAIAIRKGRGSALTDAIKKAQGRK